MIDLTTNLPNELHFAEWMNADLENSASQESTQNWVCFLHGPSITFVVLNTTYRCLYSHFRGRPFLVSSPSFHFLWTLSKFSFYNSKFLSSFYCSLQAFFYIWGIFRFGNLIQFLFPISNQFSFSPKVTHLKASFVVKMYKVLLKEETKKKNMGTKPIHSFYSLYFPIMQVNFLHLIVFFMAF